MRVCSRAQVVKVQNEVTICKNRKLAMDAITRNMESNNDDEINTAEDDLGGLIMKIRNKFEGCVAAGSAQERTLVAPPCRSFGDLLTLCSFGPLIENIKKCTTAPQIDQLTANMQKHKVAIVELLGTCKSAASSLKSVVGAWRKQIEQQEQQGQKAKAAAKAKASAAAKGKAAKSSCPIYDAGGAQIPQFLERDLEAALAKMDLTMPFLVRLARGNAIFKGVCKSAHEDFEKKWAKCDQRVDPGRALRVPKDAEVQSVVGNLVARLLGDCVRRSPEKFRKDLCAAYCFGIAANSESVCYEKHFLPTMRINMSGTREVTVIKTSPILDAMRSADANLPSDLQAATMLTFVKSLSVEACQKLCGCGCFFKATVAASEAIFIPSGYIVAERVIGDRDNTGFKMTALLPHSAEALRGIIATFSELKDVPEANEILEIMLQDSKLCGYTNDVEAAERAAAEKKAAEKAAAEKVAAEQAAAKEAGAEKVAAERAAAEKEAAERAAAEKEAAERAAAEKKAAEKAAAEKVAAKEAEQAAAEKASSEKAAAEQAAAKEAAAAQAAAAAKAAAEKEAADGGAYSPTEEEPETKTK